MKILKFCHLKILPWQSTGIFGNGGYPKVGDFFGNGGGGGLTPLQTVQRLPNVLREYEKEALAWNGLKCVKFWQIVNIEVMFGNLLKIHSDFKIR